MRSISCCGSSPISTRSSARTGAGGRGFTTLQDGRRRGRLENKMRWAQFRYKNTVSYGIVTGNRVEPVSGSPFSKYVRGGESVPLSQVKLLPPVIPGTFYAVVFNYLGHTAEAGEFLKKPQKIPQKPDVGYRSASALIGA